MGKTIFYHIGNLVTEIYTVLTHQHTSYIHTYTTDIHTYLYGKCVQNPLLYLKSSKFKHLHQIDCCLVQTFRNFEKTISKFFLFSSFLWIQSRAFAKLVRLQLFLINYITRIVTVLRRNETIGTIRMNEPIEVFLSIKSLSLFEAPIIDEHTVSEAAIRNVTSGHFVLICIYNIVFVIITTISSVLYFLLFVAIEALLVRCVLPTFLLVRFIVEVTEEEVEHYCMHADPPDESFRIIAIDEKQLECMNHY